MKKSTPPYVMDHSVPDESRRLALLEAWADPGTIKCINAIGVRPAWTCLEIGAGAGSIVRWLSRQVGPEGRVVATDIDCRFLSSLDLPNVEIRRHDIVSDALPERAFDLVHARLVLEHLPERAQALSKMASSLKPGGWIVIEDQDLASVAPAGQASPGTNSQFMIRSLALSRLLAAVGIDLELGRHLYGELRSNHLVDLGAEGHIPVVVGGSKLAKYWRLTWEHLRGQLIASGLLTQWDVDEFVSLLEDPQFVWMAPAIVTAWGRRPGSGTGRLSRRNK
jgi:SAM-dependent methyltransferase